MTALDLADTTFTFLGLETTGLSPWFGDRVCEIALVQTQGRRIRRSFHSLVNPLMDLSPAAASLNPLDETELSGAPLFMDVVDQLTPLLADSILVCHNAQFNLQFLDDEFHRLGREFQTANLADTLLIAREYFDLPSYSLVNVAASFYLPAHRPYRALEDALCTKNVFFALLDSLRTIQKGLEDVIGVYNSPAWPSEGIQLPVELKEAIFSGKDLRITYIDADSEKTERTVSPLQVLGLADYIYLRAFCHLRQGERTFRLDRIVQYQIIPGE